MLKFYNSLNKKKEKFIPIKNKEVKMYVCGITPYDYPHLGHARSGIVFDFIRRYLIYKGYKVKFITNFTDLDDKIINRANEIGQNPFTLSKRFIDIYFREFKLLNIMKADIYPRVTEHIPEIIELIKKIIIKGYAYKTEDGVYFEARKFKNYGKLSNQSLKEMRTGLRIEVNREKKHSEDFALWKFSKVDEPFWESPWGKGRPGWHIECSAMAMKYLGETLDIHGGGNDLIFPHHENEIAQSESATGKIFAKYWLHNGMVKVGGDKMSKSLKNFITIEDVLKKYNPMVIRYLFLSVHYRSPFDFTEKDAQAKKEAVFNLINFIKRLQSVKISFGQDKIQAIKELSRQFEQALDDDLNISLAFSEIFNFTRVINKALDKEEISKKTSRQIINLFLSFDKVLGLNLKEELKKEKIPQVILSLAKKREKLRKEKKFERADKIRKIIEQKGFLIEDALDGIRIKLL